MDAYAQYRRWRSRRPVGLPNRRLAAMLGDFVYETSSAEDESRRLLEMLSDAGERVLSSKERRQLSKFVSESERDERGLDGLEGAYLSWGVIDSLSRKTIRILAEEQGRDDDDHAQNLAALERMFDTTEALRSFRNRVAHRAPSDAGGTLHFYRENTGTLTPRVIWGWTEVAASFWSNLTAISGSVSMATGVFSLASAVTPRHRPLCWPPADMSFHGLRVIRESDIYVPEDQWHAARRDWRRLAGVWNRQHR